MRENLRECQEELFWMLFRLFRLFVFEEIFQDFSPVAFITDNFGDLKAGIKSVREALEVWKKPVFPTKSLK